ncbi:MAG: DUF3320 domain-containing protein [Lentisphaeria bacterium]|nr:DUF3320 domain-containing protein [Lentisphaeria bacterium]
MVIDAVENIFSAELSFVPLFNLALQQNALPVIYELKLINNTGSDIDDLQCRFSASPEFIIEKYIPVNKVKAGEELCINKPDIELNYDLLSALSESMKGKLKLEISDGNRILFQKDFECEAFAPDQWLGMQIMPELLASFVTPNLDVVAHLQSAVSLELERATGSASVQGYQDDKKRVYEICSAIYRAVHNWGINYSNPASSFGTPGQRIRFADAIYQYKLGTCLDTAILFASVMESCGLHPVIMLQKGHAYVGCHLVDRYFPDIPMDDLQSIRKLADLDEFLVIETTMVTGDSSFAKAEASARMEHLNIDGEFECAIDVIRARYSGIRPLPLKRSVNGVEFAPVDRKVAAQEAEKARRLEEEIDLSQLSNESTQPARIVRWTNKLLDLSLRNRLLNVRDTKLVIPVACPDITVLEDKIADNESLTLNPLANLLGEKDLHDLTMLRNSDVKPEIKLLLERELGQQRLWTMLPPNEMVRRLTALYRQGRTDLEEGGVNTLYLAIGFVEWKVSERDEKSYLAPILLLPVRLQRRSITEGIKLSRIDGETIINETLLELLRSQYHLTVPGVSPLPTDDSGVDVALVMQIFRQAIKDMKGWEVREEARIGHFSFGKFVMWNDMTARIDVLKQTPLIAHLISGGGLFDDNIEVFPPEKISEHLDLSRLYCPVSADSSQLAAVLYSEMGKSFVLHGPPGTGKSQTITNIIAHNLALGKRVLFVSEKKAALDVVHKRLSQIGLKPFCLELHSNKSGKSEVLAQFNEALQTADTGVPAEWENTVSTLISLRKELDAYVNELHRQYPNGFSAYDCFTRLLSCQKRFKSVDITPGVDFLTQSRENHLNSRQKFIDLTEAGQHISAESLPALELLDNLSWSPVIENNLSSAAKDIVSAVDKLKCSLLTAAENFALQDLKDISGIYQTAVLLEAVKNSEDIPGAFFSEEFPEKVKFIVSYAENAGNLAFLKEKLKNYRLETFTDWDFSGIEERIARNEAAFFLVKFFKNSALLKELSGLKKSGGVKLSIPELKALIPDARQYVDCLKSYEDGKDQASALLGKQWEGESTDWDGLSRKIGQCKVILDQVQAICRFDDKAKQAVLLKLQDLMPEVSRKCQRDSILRETINNMLEAWNDFQIKLQKFAGYASASTAVTDIDVLQEKTQKIIAHMPHLRNMLRYRNLREEVNACGLAALVSMFENGDISKEFAQFYDTVFFQNMLNQILSRSPLLCQFSGSVQNDRIKKFGELDAKYMDLTRKLIFAKLAANLPRRRSGPCPEGTELGILKRECEKRARRKPVRTLLEQIPTLAPVLKPCFLMSPLSVAQYLPADSAAFDLIVFDEASQIPVWDAIGVIARGKQLIVVGDPKQMPPTNFFQKGENEGDDGVPEDTEDLESILDECIAAGVHSTYLNWHYRSRHESLIAFSNHHYYEDRLYTFPAARNTEKLGIRFEFVPDGIYDRKATRTNRKEAEALVKYIFDRLEAANGNYRSVGVVTFSQAQKDLIEDLVEKERSKHPALESYFSDAQEEPLFVKNLENVQGDERDVILFSIGYAPDVNGKFSMNFGPLNRQGGERRLNVAITRAKEQVVVFSSIHANQIELSRTNAVGAAHLKYFLDYAEKKVNIYSGVNCENSRDGLQNEIADFLTRKGYVVERNVGSSGFRIDLALRHPERPEEFLLGIECDNAAYAAQKTTRDRDNLRHQVLKGLGWHTYRAWSVDWTFDREQAENALLDAIEKAKESPSELPGITSAAGEEEQEKIPETGTEPEQNASEIPPAVSEKRQEYHIWKNLRYLDQEDFYEYSGRGIIQQQIAEVITREAPIYENLLKRRIARAWGFSRTGGNIQRVLDECLPKNLETTQHGEDRVFWSAEQTAAGYSVYRVGNSDETKRTIDEIPPEELANAMYEVLIDFNSCEKEILFRETVKLFGLSAVTARARKFLEYGFSALQKSGRI